MESNNHSWPFTKVDRPTFIRLGLGPKINVPHRFVHEAFSNAATATPSTVAVEHDGDRITYGELEAASTNLSLRLRSLGVCPRNRVLLLVQRANRLVVAIFAVLKSCCQYVTMDVGVASDVALAHVLSEAEPPVVLYLDRYLRRVQQFATPGTQIMSLEEPWTASQYFDIESSQEVKLYPDDGSYIIYSSGTFSKQSMNYTLSFWEIR